MKAIILAAGIGARMRPLTDTKAKPMLSVAGQTIIERMIKQIINHGILDICVVTGYFHDELETYLSQLFPSINLTFIYNEIYYKTNNIYSMYLALQNYPIDDDLLLLESDLVFSETVLDKAINCPFQNLAVVDKYQAGMDGTVVVVDGDIVTNIIPPHLQGPNFDYGDKFKTLNIYKFSKEFIDTSFRKLLSFYTTVYDDNCYYELILGIIVYMHYAQIHACNIEGSLWYEVDDPNDLRIAEILFSTTTSIETLDKSFGGFWNLDITDFAFIRNMYFPNNAIIAEMKFNLPKLIQNYGSTKQILNQKLANFLLTSPEYVCLLNGLSQIYPILKCLFADKKVLIPAPTFGEYDRIFNNKLKYFDDESTSFEDTPANFISEAEIIVFVNPNNPTGSFIDNNRIMSIARQMPDKLFLVDESFCEFTGQDSIQSLLLKEPLNNIWVLKSLSKSLGVPGIRIGYIFSRDKDAIMKLNELLPIWNNNSFAEFFLEIILKYRNQLTESCKRTIIDREAFFDELKQLPAVDFIFPSKANFMLIRLNLSKDELSDLRNFLLIDHKIYIKDCSSKFMDGKTYIRVAVRSPEENSRLINALKTYSKAFI